MHLHPFYSTYKGYWSYSKKYPIPVKCISPYVFKLHRTCLLHYYILQRCCTDSKRKATLTINEGVGNEYKQNKCALVWRLIIQSNAWDWDYTFVSISRRTQFVSISGWLFISCMQIFLVRTATQNIWINICHWTTLKDQNYLYSMLFKIFLNWCQAFIIFLLIMNVLHGNLSFFWLI